MNELQVVGGRVDISNSIGRFSPDLVSHLGNNDDPHSATTAVQRKTT